MTSEDSRVGARPSGEAPVRRRPSRQPPVSRVLRTLLVAVGTAGVVMLGASTAQATPGPEYYGANIQPMVKLQVVPPDRWDAYVAQMSADGLKIARADALWSWVEPTQPDAGTHTYTWDPSDRPDQSMDRIVLLLARHGVRLLPTLTTAPSWAGGGGATLAPEHYGDYATFAGAFAARYGSNGSFWAAHPEVAPMPIADYEIWSEANSANFWTREADPVEYARGLVPVSAAIHQADPAGRVLASIGWQDYDGYMRALYAAGAKGSFDAVGFHPYAPHAVAIIDLVRGMRRSLINGGDPQLPIDVTETGQPRAPSGPGNARAGSGLVSDQARAATHSLTGDALAHSDCGVGDYLLYALVGSETSKEPGAEGFMGMYNVQNAAPNITGAAIRDASLRWRASRQTGLALCSGGTTAAANLLPLGLSVAHVSPTCVTGVTTYFRNPLESAQLTLRTDDGRVSRSETDSSGQGEVCIPDGPPIYTFDVTSEIANVAVSPTYRCKVLGGACSVIHQPASTASVVAAGKTPARGCSYTLTVKLTKVTSRRAKTKARFFCTGKKLAASRVSVLVQRRGHKTRRLVRKVTLRGGRTLSFTVKARVRRGDRIVLKHALNKAAASPYLEAHAIATRSVGARR